MRFFLLLLPIFVINPAFAEYNTWFGLSHTLSFSKNYSLLAQGQLRGNSSFELIETQSRVGVIYKIKNDFKIGGGIFGSLDKNNSFQEFRPWQQIIYTKHFSSFKMSSRLRQEQRFYTQDNTLAHRTRVLIQFSKKLFRKDFYIANELMLGLNSVPISDVKKGINQNRVHLGVKISLAQDKEINLAWRYINKYYEDLPQENIHVLFIQLRTH